MAVLTDGDETAVDLVAAGPIGWVAATGYFSYRVYDTFSDNGLDEVSKQGFTLFAQEAKEFSQDVKESVPKIEQWAKQYLLEDDQ